MKISAQLIFKEFKDKVIDSDYTPFTPVDTLKARLTATWLLQDRELKVIQQAKAFIQKTSIFPEADLSRLQSFSAHIKTWSELHICSTYSNTVGCFLEYKLFVTTLENLQQTIHFHAQYKVKNKHCFFVAQTLPLIRIIGDPVLHQPGTSFPAHPSLTQQQELAQQIEHAKTILIHTGGAGIAANQCAEIKHPYRFTIIGVFYELPEHAIRVAQRYPNTKFPQAKIMVNPLITNMSQEKQPFNHGCLSVPCANRCTVLSPREISVKYQDPLDNLIIKQLTYSGIDAVVLWHELTHILLGKTYMDVVFESIALTERAQFKLMLENEVQKRQLDTPGCIPCLNSPPFYLSVKINEAGTLGLDIQELADVLPNMTDETIYGLANQIRLIDENN
jgi:peptide deformylase